MRGAVWVRRCAAKAGVAVMVALVMAVSAAAADAAPVWGPAVPYGVPSSSTETLFLSISCVSAGNCVAVGLSDASGETPIVAAESSGSWGPETAVTQLPADALPVSASATLDSVSCTSATSCVAVGQYENSADGTNAMEVPISVSGSSATPGQAVPVALPSPATTADAQSALLAGVSCNAAGACTAVGFYVDGAGVTLPMTAAPSGAAWNATEVTGAPLDAKAVIELTAISCPPSGACEAVGNYADTAGDEQAWAVTVTAGVAGQGVTVGLPPDFVPSSDTGFDPVGILNQGFNAVSCPSAGVCTAAGSYTTTGAEPLAVAVPITNGAPGTPVKLSPSGSPLGLITAIWCSDAQDCVVGGIAADTSALLLDGVTGSETGGTWSPLAPLQLGANSALSLLTSLTCASADRCVAAGIEATSGVGASATAFFANSGPPLSVSSTSLPAAQVGVPYSATLQTANGSSAASWSIGLGSLPAGLSLDASTGVISGTPSANGQNGFIVVAADTGPPVQTATAGLSITVSPAPAPPTAKIASQPQTPTVKVAFLSTSAKNATVVLSCTGASCAGGLKIAGVEHLKSGKPTAVVGAHNSSRRKAGPATKTITLASGRYALAAGDTEVAKLRLSGKARQLLAGLKKVSGDLTVTPLGATGPAVVEKATFKATSGTLKKAHPKVHKKPAAEM
jgi:large repetitive protein